MARGVNKVILIGNLGQDPEVRSMPSGSPVANLRVATTDSWKDRQTGQQQERTEWHSVVLFNRLAEIAQQYLKKGSRVYLEGRLQTRKWQGQDGQDRYSTEIVVNDMQMLDSRGVGGQGAGMPQSQQQAGGYENPQSAPMPPQGGNYGPPPYQGGHAGSQQQQRQQPPASAGHPPQGGQQQGNYGAPDPGSFDDFDSEIPF